MTDDPRLLYSIANVKAYHIQDGTETDLCPSGAQTLSLLMVPETSPFADSSTGTHEQDFYLHLSLPPELDLPLPATTQIFHQPPQSYLIPRWDLHEGGAFTRIEFAPLGRGTKQEDIDTFETILAQCTAFHERASAPQTKKSGKGSAPAYNPADYKDGQAYVHGTANPNHGQVVLVNEDNGSVVGELAEDGALVEDSDIKPGYKDPVEISISSDGKKITVKPLSEDYLSLARHPAYKSSSLVQNAAAASRLLVTSSDYIANLMASGAENFTAKTKPSKPVQFNPTTHDRARKISAMTGSVATLSAKTVGQATKIAQNVGATLARRGEAKTKEDKLNAKGDDYKPGLLNKSMIAFSTIADGIATGGKHLLDSSGTAATAMVGHRYGEDARKVAGELTKSVTTSALST